MADQRPDHDARPDAIRPAAAFDAPSDSPVRHVNAGILVEPGRGRIIVRAGGVVLADCQRPIVVLEGRYPVRYYIPPEDVRRELLVPSWETTYCPYKGNAVHFALAPHGDGGAIAWSYPVPLRGMEALTGLIAFYQERVDIDVDPSH
ncbi:DUF427 domain-containing protein [Kitasatospora sp. NPDC091207]|uniref:DUF427 domain-containing protein n=1 Tax=Kitasatospora sp. NPDC091207 TaxID=3364083 RepID=UPI0037F169E0